MDGWRHGNGSEPGTRWRREPLSPAVWATLVALMLVPLLAKTVTADMAWSIFDFAFFGTLLFGAGVTYELAARRTGNAAYLAGVGVAVAAAFVLVLVTGAVGIIGSEDDDANLMYGGVLAIGIIGSLIARFDPDGMARALMATGLA